MKTSSTPIVCDPALSANTADTEFEENPLQRAETGEGGLKKVESNKGRKKQPDLIYPVSEGQSG